MRILGIETSCDDTGIAVVEDKPPTMGKMVGGWPRFRILSNVVASQVEVHKKYGGVYPTLAKREHQKNLPAVLEKALAQAQVPQDSPGGSQDCPGVDAIAVTYGPGLSPCLWAGITFAQDLAAQWQRPLVPINHMEGHLLLGLFGENQPSKNVFPAVALLVSGGHTQLILVKGIGKYELLGETRDDAAGEAFDKTARILGLGYPGGPAIAKAAQQHSSLRVSLPRPMVHSKNLDFSFSGLKTAVLYDYKKRAQRQRKSKAYIAAMAKEIQQAIIDVLLAKTLRATQQENAKSVILGGGVAANQELRSQLRERVQREGLKLQLFLPEAKLATDNGAMAAVAGYVTLLRTKDLVKPQTIAAAPNLQLE